MGKTFDLKLAMSTAESSRNPDLTKIMLENHAAEKSQTGSNHASAHACLLKAGGNDDQGIQQLILHAGQNIHPSLENPFVCSLLPFTMIVRLLEIL
jgi:hypothetical protein